MAVGFPTKANWAAGDILTAAQMDDLAGTVNTLSPVGQANGSTLVANSANASGLGWQPLNAAGKNAVINGGMDNWQRGTSFTSAWGGNGTYTADRFSIYHNATGGTVTRQTVSDTTNLPTIQYCARIARNNADTSVANFVWAYTLESADSYRFAGQTVVLSFYARKGANYSAASNALTVSLQSGTGTDQNVNLPFTGAATVASGTATLTTTWQRFQYTGTVGAAATELGMTFTFTPTGTAGAADYFEITGVQVELGSTASTFSRAGGTIQGELAACQRYYQRMTGTVINNNFGVGTRITTTGLYVPYYLPVQMRTSPTFGVGNQTYFNVNNGLTNTATTAVALDQSSPYIASVVYTTSSSTAGTAGNIYVNTAGAYLEFIAEL